MSNVRNLFRDPGCTCADVSAQLNAAFSGAELEPCPVHQADELAARRRDRDRAGTVAERDRLRDAVDEQRAADRIAAGDRAQAEHDAAQAEALAELARIDPFTAELTRTVGADARVALRQLRPEAPAPSSVVPIGDDAALKRIVTDALGSTDGDLLPPAA